MLVGCVAWDIFRLGFFADDIHFLDVARRIPLGQLLQGQYGIWPWYRPLSRELFFWLLVKAGPLGVPLAHVAGLVGLWAASCAVWRLAERLVGTPAAAVAPVLFATYQFTKFLTAWGSGFQDVMAIALTLWAVVHQSRGHRGLALALAGLAPFAKETGFTAVPLVIAWSVLCEGERRCRPWMLGQAAVAAAAVVVHLWARHTWTMGGTAAEIEPSALRLAGGLAQLLGGFLTLPGATGGLSVAIALVAAGCVWTLVQPRPRAGPAPSPGLGAGGAWFLTLASAAGLAPMVVGHAFALTMPHPYYAFPALPWISLALARLARRAPVWWLKAGLGTLVAVNAWGLAFHAPVRGDSAYWQFRRWDWFEAVRLSEVTRHLTGEIRSLFPSHPESLVVLYGKLPSGSLFQTEDGPSTREALRDLTVRAYLINGVPVRVSPGRFAIVVYDDENFCFREDTRDFRTMVNRAATSLMFGRPRTALAWALHADSVYGSRFELAYVRAGSLLVSEGLDAYLRELAAAGYVDSSGTKPALLARAMWRDDSGLASAYEGLLRRPRTAAAHAALAESLLARGAFVDCGVALRVAATLDPARLADRLRLATLLVAQGEAEAARAELQTVALSGVPSLVARARAELAQLGR